MWSVLYDVQIGAYAFPLWLTPLTVPRSYPYICRHPETTPQETTMRRFVLPAFALTVLAACSDLMGATVGTYELVGHRGGSYNSPTPPSGGWLWLYETGTYDLSLIWSGPDTTFGSGTWLLNGHDIHLSPPWPNGSSLGGTVEPDTVTIDLDNSNGGPNAAPTELLFARR